MSLVTWEFGGFRKYVFPLSYTVSVPNRHLCEVQTENIKKKSVTANKQLNQEDKLERKEVQGIPESQCVVRGLHSFSLNSYHNEINKLKKMV